MLLKPNFNLTSTWYPPSRYVLYPFYKWVRKIWGLKQSYALIVTIAFSAILHGLFVGILKGAKQGIAITIIFFIFGLITIRIIGTHATQRKRKLG